MFEDKCYSELIVHKIGDYTYLDFKSSCKYWSTLKFYSNANLSLKQFDKAYTCEFCKKYILTEAELAALIGIFRLRGFEPGSIELEGINIIFV